MPSGRERPEAREAILARVRAATADVPAGEQATWRREDDADPAVAYRPAAPGPADDAVLVLLAERIGDYTATVTRVAAEAGVASAVGDALARHDAGTLAVAPGVPAAWRAVPGVAWLEDDPPLDHDALAGADGVLTGCALAIAETGTVVLDAGPASGRRVLTLLVDLHVCVVRAEQVVADVVGGVAGLQGALAAGRPVTLVSGPSATSDIELDRVEGVHGPRRLEVVLVG